MISITIRTCTRLRVYRRRHLKHPSLLNSSSSLLPLSDTLTHTHSHLYNFVSSPPTGEHRLHSSTAVRHARNSRIHSLPHDLVSAAVPAAPFPFRRRPSFQHRLSDTSTSSSFWHTFFTYIHIYITKLFLTSITSTASTCMLFVFAAACRRSLLSHLPRAVHALRQQRPSHLSRPYAQQRPQLCQEAHIS